MRSSRLTFLWFVAFLISWRSNLVGSVPTSDYGRNNHMSKVIAETTVRHEEQPSSVAPFFSLGKLFQLFMRKDTSTAPVELNSIKTKQIPPTLDSATLRQTESLENEKSPLDYSSKVSSSESRPQAQTTAKELGSTTQVQKHEISDRDFSDASSSSLAPVFATADQSTGGTEDSAIAGVSTFPALGHAIDESNRRAYESSLTGTHDGHLARTEPDSHRLDRRRMLIPMKGKVTVSEQSTTDESRRTSAKENNLSPVSRKIQEYAEKISTTSSEDAVVKIGNATIPRQKVAVVGDVDGNKIQDYIVMNMAANNHSGTVRLYLMAEHNKFLYSRELVPGNWGFQHSSLNPGDRYGTTVFRLPNTSNSSQCFIAITAPGDTTMEDASGAVYVLELSAKGNVNKHTKLSATDFLRLVEEQKKDGNQPSTGQIKLDQRSRSSRKQDMQHLDGVTSVVFFNSSGGVQAFINVQSSKDKDLLQSIDRHLQGDRTDRKTPNHAMNLVSSGAGENGSCFFNKTHCDCKLESSTTKERKDCYEMFESKKETGNFICLSRVCPPTYKCSCDGDTRCRRVQEAEEIYVPHATGHNGEVYCTAEVRMALKTVPIITS